MSLEKSVYEILCCVTHYAKRVKWELGIGIHKHTTLFVVIELFYPYFGFRFH
jgi:hypothetical protein